MGTQMYTSGSTQERPALLLDTRRAENPVLGTHMAFQVTASPELAGISAKVTEIWPCFRPDDYVVTLEYEQPVRHGNIVSRRIYAFLSELERLQPQARVRPV